LRRLFYSGLLVSSLILSMSLVVFIGCDKIKTSYTYSPEIEKTKVTLTYHNIFDLRAVQRVRRSTDTHDQEVAARLFEEALSRKKKGQFSRSSDLFKKAILTYPTSKSYYHLGEVALELNQTEMAVSSLKMAELLNFPNLGNLYIRLSKAYSIQNDLKNASKYLTLGLQKGYSDLNSIIYDPGFKNIKVTEEYREAVADVVHDEKARKKALFDLYISKFPVKTLPFALDNESIENFDYDLYIPYDFQELMVAKYMKDDTREYSFVARVDSTTQYIAVIYSSINSIEDDYPASVENYLVTYDRNGNILDHTMFACNCSPTLMLTGSINEEKEIVIAEQENIWKFDPSTTEYIKNEIEETVVKAKHHLRISKYGRIYRIEKEIPAKTDSTVAII
jgi:tetratricopeptide (TPR) repeat protein